MKDKRNTRVTNVTQVLNIFIGDTKNYVTNVNQVINRIFTGKNYE